MPPTRTLDVGAIRSAVQGLASQNWIREPSPLDSLPGLAQELGVAQIWVKRDDALLALGGGSKVRKLDILLAQPLYRDSRRWHTTGARGSGHLVACARAAVELNHQLVAHVCPQVKEGDDELTLFWRAVRDSAEAYAELFERLERGERLGRPQHEKGRLYQVKQRGWREERRLAARLEHLLRGLELPPRIRWFEAQ